MDDCEPFGVTEFFHERTFKDGTTNTCRNAGKSFFEEDLDRGTEVEPFMRKRTRRATKGKR
jgi:hypothetical protein